jgi:lipopolysaccharide/colanic/teichoic acid biosynthesis glycosyltransferase
MPLLAALALLTRLLLGSPVLFRQSRTGFQKKTFTIYKFRTMRDAWDVNGNPLADSERLTGFGRFLRSTSLDELPELWNILLGEMSLVGPRPLLPRYNAFYSERENKRFEALPGLTGWAQINGRNSVGWDKRLELDVQYIENCSLGLDLKILFATVAKVLSRENVHVNTDVVERFLDEERAPKFAAQLDGFAGTSD